MDPTRIGNYRIAGRIGEGAMGVVYKAHDETLGRLVAIKTISASLLSDEHYRKRFQREARSAAQLNHPNIVTVFELVETGRQTYLVMELLQGTDLRELIARGRLPDLDGRLAIVEQILEGLAFAHAKGVVHRDLKPANIRILPDGTAKLLDFGLARLGVSEMTRTGTVMGTPNYMSPEQIRAEPVDQRSDVFSVGAILYELLAGRRAFDAENMHATFFEVLERDPPSLALVVPGLPPSLVATVEKALAKLPEQRYESAGQMGEGVRRARQGLAPGQTIVLPPAPQQIALSSDVGAASGDSSSWNWRRTPTASPTATFTPTVHRDTTQASPHVFGSALPLLEPATEVQTSETTARPEPTVLAPSATPSSAPRKSRLLLGLLAAATLFGVAGLMRVLLPPGPPTLPDRGPDQETTLRTAVVATRIELARLNLENKDYSEASRHLQVVLAIDPENRQALEMVTDVRETLEALELAAQEARAAVERGDVRGATEALTRVLAIDAHHPVAGELTARLNRYFKLEAEQAWRANAAARLEAVGVAAGSTEPFNVATRLAREAEALFAREAYAEATQKFSEASDSFGRARRSAETTAAQAAVARAAAQASALPSLARAETSPPSSALGGSLPGPASITPGPTTAAPVAPPTASSLTPSPPAITAPSSPTVAEQTGSLRVTAKPWAEVSVDEVKHGRTPLNGLVLAAGSHAMVLKHPDYQPLRRVVTIKAGELTAVAIDMRDEALRKR